MKRQTQIWISSLPLLAFLLAAGLPVPVRHQSTSQQRHRIQRPTRTSGVRLDGDHHHEEIPHYLAPQSNTGDPAAPPGDTTALLDAAAPQLPSLEGGDEPVPSFVVRASERFPLFPSGRSPPASL